MSDKNVTVLTNDKGDPLKADQGESRFLQVRFYNPKSNVQFRKEQIVTLTLTLLNEEDNAVINEVDAVDINDTGRGSITDDGVLTLNLLSADNILTKETVSEETHLIILTWTWVDDDAVSQTGIEKFSYIISNTETADEAVVASATASVVDLSGIKRVKTKHMEIEAHDPRAVQEARDKEENPIPTFCGLLFCKGTPKCN